MSTGGSKFRLGAAIAAILVIPGSSFYGVWGDKAYSLSNEPHDSINIVGDSGFTNASGVTWGSGTPEDPYVIEGWDASVRIVNTTSYVVIRNMTIMGVPTNIWFSGGLFLTNVTNCAIECCELVPAPYEDFTAFWIEHCSNVTVRNNRIEKYTYIYYSDDIEFSSNLVLEHTITIKQSQ